MSPAPGSMSRAFHIFDLDGTLSDPSVGIGRSLNHALQHFGHAPIPAKEVSQYIGPPLDQIFRSRLAGISAEHVVELVAKYRERYADLPDETIAVIENGYEEESFEELPAFASTRHAPGPLLLLHSGVVYPSERDPTQLFQALRRLLHNGVLGANELRVRLRAAGHESILRKLIAAHEVDQVVELAPSIPYREALREMMQADGLLVLQAANCNEQVPAKIYEYLRCRRPIIALTDPAGDTAAVMRRAGLHDIARLDSADEIVSALCSFIQRLKTGDGRLPDPQFTAASSRLQRTEELAHLLDGV